MIKNRNLVLFFVTIVLLIVHGKSADADKLGDLRREQLAKVKRIAILPLFFGSDTLRDKKQNAPKFISKSDTNGKSDKPEYPLNLEGFRTHLQKMETRANERLPARVAERTPYVIVPAKEQVEALKAAALTPTDLFQNGGMMKGTKFALPDIVAIKKLAKSLNADALLIGAMEEPRRANGGPNGLFSYSLPHVSSRIIYYVLLPDGTDVFHYTIDVARPLSRIVARDYTRDYTMVDWLETVDQNIENFLDEFARYTPAKAALKQ